MAIYHDGYGPCDGFGPKGGCCMCTGIIECVEDGKLVNLRGELVRRAPLMRRIAAAWRAAVRELGGDL